MSSPESIAADIFIRTYRSMLKSGGEVEIEQLILPYIKINPALHPLAGSARFDSEGFTYAFFRLPRIIWKVNQVYLAQTQDLFHRSDLPVETWEEVAAPARRRKMFFDGKEKLAVYINSVTDLDDFIALLTAFQIEWNKLHEQLRAQAKVGKTPTSLRGVLALTAVEKKRLSILFGGDEREYLAQLTRRRLAFRVESVRGSFIDYQKAATLWFEEIASRSRYHDFTKHPVYFVQSNTHSLVNTITGWVNTHERRLIAYLRRQKMKELLSYWRKIRSGGHAGARENFLWYVLKKYEREYPKIRDKRKAHEQGLGIDYIEARRYLDVNAQLLAVSQLPQSHLSAKLDIKLNTLNKSDAFILNIDYPLGFGAYMVLSTILANCSQIRGVYILGKASFFAGNLGDIALPDTIHDERTQNTFFFRNAFDKSYFSSLRSNNVLENQRAASIKGTLILYKGQWESLARQGVTVVEMEGGSYLNALYEGTHYDRYPEGEAVNLVGSPIDIGIIHYASDTPFTKAITLGTRNLGYEGVDATYTSSLAILRRIVELELGR